MQWINQITVTGLAVRQPWIKESVTKSNTNLNNMQLLICQRLHAIAIRDLSIKPPNSPSFSLGSIETAATMA